MLPDSFSDHAALVAPELREMCAGCTRVLGGRPGDDPPPLRTTSLLLVDDELTTIDRERMWASLIAPPGDVFVLSWARSKKKHHVLYAKHSTPRHYEIGSDGETVDYVRARDEVLLDSVRELMTTHTRKAIRSGIYHQSRVSSFGAPRHAALEAIVSVYRRGRPTLLDLVLCCCPKDEQPKQEVSEMIHPIDDQAARLLGAIAYGSSYRVEHGIDFWSGFFPHQVERFKTLPLSNFTARLMETLQVRPTYAAPALRLLRELDEADTASVEESIRVRTSLVVAISYERAKGFREER